MRCARYEVKGLAHGVSREWSSGRPMKVAVCRYGIEVRSRSWDERGLLERAYVMPAEGGEAIRRREAEFRDAVEAEDIPPEFRDVPDGEWDG